MQLLEGLKFVISDGRIFVTTPHEGMDISDFLQTMRRSLDTWRRVGEQVKALPALAPNINSGECVK